MIKSNPTLVQAYVCAELQGSRDMTGSQAAKYLAASSAVQGVPGDQIVAATKDYPFIPPSEQLYWLGSTPHDPGSRIVQAYVQTGNFLVSQGRADLGAIGGPDRRAHRQHVHHESAGRWLPELRHPRPGLTRAESRASPAPRS